jgi:predicted TIM-barrel fold metal-dependent hydrolase
MSANRDTGSAALRSRLSHPVIDADGHYLEFSPILFDYLKEVGGARAADGLKSMGARVLENLKVSNDERRKDRRAIEAWWAVPARNTLDRATALLPKLLYERLDEFGFDFTVLYPTLGLRMPFIPDAESRRVACRAFNRFLADQFGEFSDRMTPAAVIPMHTPQEAIEELEYAVRTLGLKVVMLQSMVIRSLNPQGGRTSEAAGGLWFDVLGIDSDRDYDPVWAKCVELGVAPTLHGGSRGMGLRKSPSNFVYNHIGHFAAASEATCKALFLGGVTRRFPTLNFAFLEGGVGWACTLYSDLIGHWKKRNLKALEEVNPANLDRNLLLDLITRYAGGQYATSYASSREVAVAEGGTATGGLEQLDDYARCEIANAQDIRDLFCRPFYFGCEADDPVNAWAFDRRVNPYGAQMKTLLGSDIGHFDVTDMSEVLLEAHELVDHGLINQDQFKDFVFTNAVRFWGEGNREFFKGTVVESAAAKLLGQQAA